MVELEPVAPGRRRGPWSALIVSAMGIAIVAIALATGEPEPAEPPRSPPAQASAALPRPSPSQAAPRSVPRPMPGVVACTDVRLRECLDSVRLALDLLDPSVPPVREAAARPGIVCGDTLDCPPHRLRRMVRPVASVILSFSDASPSAWVNVIEQQRGRPADAPLRLDAWLVRWR